MAGYKRVRDTRGDNGISEFGTSSSTRWVKKGTKAAKSGEHMGPKKIKRALKSDAKVKNDIQSGKVSMTKPKPKQTRTVKGGKAMS